MRTLAVVLVSALAATFVATGPTAGAVGGPAFEIGSGGIGDPYYPKDGNGGYDVGHYKLDIEYDPATDRLEGVATITATATIDLARFNLDLDGLTVRSITVSGRTARWSRLGGELRIRPAVGIPSGRGFVTKIRYDGIPNPQSGAEEGSGFIPTDDGALVVGQPHVASTWFPVNDHPRDIATYTIAITVPEGLQAVANGALVSQTTNAGKTRWLWRSHAPMASYLATATIGEFDLDSYHDDGGRPGGIDYVDAIDPDLFTGLAPHTGTQFALSQTADSTYKRLTRDLVVPAEGADLSFWVNRYTEPTWDFFFVEAHATDDDWTTLADDNGHTLAYVGSSCPGWLELHPFLEHYQEDDGDGGCSPSGTTGTWSAATGLSDGWEQWRVDLSAFAHLTAEVSITYVSDETVQHDGVAVDDIEVSTGEGDTSFEDDGNTLDGWTVSGAAEGSELNTNDWMVGTAADAPASLGDRAQAILDRQPEIIDFLSQTFGPYPFADAGAIVDDLRDLGFALENQTRPIYAPEFFTDPDEGAAVVVHELAHQWYGDLIPIHAWKHIWLNEGFATYAEWLWSEHEGEATAQDIFDFLYGIPDDDPFWSVTVADPGTDELFGDAVYYRGAMTLHQLRLKVGDTDFFEILRQWASPVAGRASTTRNFMHLAEQVSGQQLDNLFSTWLFSRDKPKLSGSPGDDTAASSDDLPPTPGHPAAPLRPSRGPVPPR